MPEVSVVIPAYNHGRFIRAAVESVLNQTWSDLEVIVIDDGSKDDTQQVLAMIRDSRLKVISQENQGAHAAINRGLHLAAGKYLSILNSDDVYHPQRLEKCRSGLENDPQIGLICSYIQIIDENSQPLGIKHGYHDCEPWLLEHPELSFRAADQLKDALLTENYLATTSNYFFSRHWFDKTGDFRPLRFTHDWDFALRLTQLADLAMINEPLLSYRVHHSNTIRQDQAAMIFEICWILAMHLPHRTGNPDFMGQPSSEKRIEQLLYSIYTFQCEQVLNVLLLEQLHLNNDRALRLLDPEDAARKQYIHYIQQKIQSPENTQAEQVSAPNSAMAVKSASKRLLRRLLGDF